MFFKTTHFALKQNKPSPLNFETCTAFKKGKVANI